MRWKTIVGVVALLAGLGPPALAEPAGPVVHDQRPPEPAYWTPERMAGATPGDADRTETGWFPWARHFRGVPSVGALFFRGGDGDHYCTATLMRSPGNDLVLTAAHCLYGRAHRYVSRVVFVPRYQAGRRPFGVWPIGSIVLDRRWARHLDPDLDFAFATVRPVRGRRIGRLIPGNRLGTDRGFRNWVEVIGYPNLRTNYRDTAIRCRSLTSRAARFQVRFACGGFTGGTSGSPWLAHYDRRTGTGEVVGVIGGLHGGGWTSTVSYTAYFDHDIRRLYTIATGSLL